MVKQETRQFWFHTTIDRPLAHQLTRFWHRSESIDALCIIVAKWTPLVMLCLIAAASFGLGLPTADHHAAIRGAVLAVVAAIIARMANEPISRLVSRPRPFEEFTFSPLLWHDKGGGFPSNHATGAFALAVSLCMLPGYGVCLLVLAVLLTISRVYSGLHYLSDVIAGALHGTFWAMVIAILIRLWLH